MSEPLTTLDEKVVIRSFAYLEGFKLSAIHEEKGKLDCKEFSWESYGSLLKRLWEDYIIKGWKPELLGYALSDKVLVTETLHYIAPASFNNREVILPPNQESLIYWLKLQNSNIAARIGNEAFQNLDKGLDYILLINLGRKKK